MSTAPRATWAQRIERGWATRGALAIALLPLACLFGVITATRRFAYGIGLRRSASVAVPVVVVGNIVAGGAGKTPTVMAIVALLRERGFTPGIVSRGYGRLDDRLLDLVNTATASQSGDEPLLLRLRTGAPLVVGKDRVAASRMLVSNHPTVDVIVSDDGLQHLALARDVQVIVFDERGVGNGWLLPSGPLRESLPSQVPPRTLVVYNASSATTTLPGTTVRRSLSGVVALADWWNGSRAETSALEAMRGRPVIAAAGVARPKRFFDMLRASGLLVTELPLPDHHEFATLPWPPTAADVIVTEKDAIKLDAAAMGTTRVWVAPLDFALDPAFDAALFDLLPRPRHGNPPA